jgi:hypothetical protein
MLQAGSLGGVEATDIFLVRHENKIMWVQVYCTQWTHVARAFLSEPFCVTSLQKNFKFKSTEKVQPLEKKSAPLVTTEF